MPVIEINVDQDSVPVKDCPMIARSLEIVLSQLFHTDQKIKELSSIPIDVGRCHIDA